MAIYQPQPLRFKPGIQRDGTRLDAPGSWVDGKWVRFVNGRARKIKGVRRMDASTNGSARSFENYFKDGTHHLHYGTSQGVFRQPFSSSGVVSSSPVNRTPAAYVPTNNEIWQFGTAYDPIIANAASIIAHPGINRSDISNATATSIYIGPATDSTDLTIGTIAIGQYLKRVGTTIVGAAAAGAAKTLIGNFVGALDAPFAANARWYPSSPSTVTRAWASLGEHASGVTEFDVLKNGVSILPSPISIATGDYRSLDVTVPSVAVLINEHLTISLITANGGSNAVVIVEYE